MRDFLLSTDPIPDPANRKKGNRLIIAMACIMLLQCVDLLYWQSQRGNFHIDEFYCFGYASSYVKDAPDRPRYITDDSTLWKFDEWMQTDELQARLRVDDSESIYSLCFPDRLKLFANKRAYMGFLNRIMSDAGYSASFYTYAWGAFFFNLWLFLIAEVLMLWIVRTLTGSDDIAVLSIIMFGFSGIIMSMCEFVRFYMLAVALLLTVIACHIKLWDEKSVWKCLCFELTAFICAYYGVRHSEFMLVTCGTFFCLFFAGMLLRKKWLQSAVYAVPLLYGMYRFLYLKTNLLQAVMHPSQFAEATHGLPGATYNFINWTPEAGLENLDRIYTELAENWFGYKGFLIACLLILAAYAVYTRLGCKQMRARHPEDNRMSGLVVILLLTALISMLFNDLARLLVDRYQTFITVLLMIVMWYFLSRLQTMFDTKSYLAVLTALTVISGCLCQQPARFSYLYPEQRQLRDTIEMYDDKDCVLFTDQNRHAAYDALGHAGTGTKIISISPDKIKRLYKTEGLPDEFLLWNPRTGVLRRGIKDEINLRMLKKIHYEYIGSTHLNDVYLCTKVQ